VRLWAFIHTYRHAGPACGVFFSGIIEKPTEEFRSVYDLQLRIFCLVTRRALAHGLPCQLPAQRFGQVKISDWLKEDDCSPNSRKIFLQVGWR
jgi:hypothetical protein